MRFSEIYRSSSPVISFEFFPPKDPQKLDESKALIRRLSLCNPAFMTVTFGAGGTTQGLTQELVRFIRHEVALPAVQHLTCVGHSRSYIDEMIGFLEGDGIQHILALRGDPPKGSEKFEPHPDGFTCARDLTRYISSISQLSIAVAGYPEIHPDATSRASDLQYLKEKVDAGAELIITQLFFENDLYFRFVDEAQSIGVKVPIVPGVMPIGNIAQLKRTTGLCGASLPQALLNSLQSLEERASRAADSTQASEQLQQEVIDFGTDYATEQVKSLLAGGAPGVHLYTLNKFGQVESIMKELQS